MINTLNVIDKSPDRQSSRTGHAGVRVLTGPYRPLVQLMALLPLVILYEAAIPLATDRTRFYHRIDAWSQWALSQIGLTGTFLPGVLILGTLLACHIVRRDPWRFHWADVGRLAGESLLWVVPLFVLFLLFTLPVGQLVAAGLQITSGDEADLFSSAILSIGAGLFEEFVFRLALVSLLLWVLQRLLAVPADASQLVSVCFAAAVFASAHFFGSGAETFTYLGFLFRAAAGIYLGAVFILRGFATGAIVHAGFNILLSIYAVG